MCYSGPRFAVDWPLRPNILLFLKWCFLFVVVIIIAGPLFLLFVLIVISEALVLFRFTLKSLSHLSTFTLHLIIDFLHLYFVEYVMKLQRHLWFIVWSKFILILGVVDLVFFILDKIIWHVVHHLSPFFLFALSEYIHAEDWLNNIAHAEASL